MRARILLAAVFVAIPVGPVSAAEPPSAEKTRALLLTGANNHDWRVTTPQIKAILEKPGDFTVDVSDDPDAPALADAEKLKDYKVIVLNLNRNKRWAPEREKNLLDFVKGGGGLVVVHASNNAFDGWDAYDKLVGGTWRSKGTSFPDRGTFHPAYGEFKVRVVKPDDPIMKGLDDSFVTTDEMYTNLKLTDDIKVLAEGTYEGKPQPLIFVREEGKGRVFHTALGHDIKAMRNPQFMQSLHRGALWAAGELKKD